MVLCLPLQYYILFSWKINIQSLCLGILRKNISSKFNEKFSEHFSLKEIRARRNFARNLGTVKTTKYEIPYHMRKFNLQFKFPFTFARNRHKNGIQIGIPQNFPTKFHVMKIEIGEISFRDETKIFFFS